MALLSVRNLSTELFTARSVLPAVDDVSFDVELGETVTFIGESGCGKSTLALSLMRLIPERAGRHPRGSVLFDGTDLMRSTPRELSKLRGSQLAMVFQDPMSALDPVATIRDQMVEVMTRHTRTSGRAAERQAAELLERVNISDPARQLRAYPHQLSGGMLQRILIAMAISTKPKLLIADEPTSALDVTVQASLFDLLLDLQQENDMGIVLITHDLGVAGLISDRINVMYAGRIVESGPAREVLTEPRMPYTMGLVACTPLVDPRGRQELQPIPGAPPALDRRPTGCNYSPRCAFAQDVCSSKQPARRLVAPHRSLECLFDLDPSSTRATAAQQVPHEPALVETAARGQEVAG